MLLIRTVWISLGLFLVLPATLKGGGDFTEIADTSGRLQSLGLFPSINGTGTVAFNGSPGLGTAGIYTGVGGALSTIAEFQGPAFSISSISPPTINGAGTVAFYVLSINGNIENQTLYTGTSGALTTVADTTGSFQAFFGIPAINGAGTVAFGAIRRDASEGIFTGSGGPLTTIAQTDGMFSSFHNNGGPSINNAGTVAFTADQGGGRGLGVFASQGGTVSPIALTGPNLTIVEGRPAINGAGTVAFLATSQIGGNLSEGIFTGSGGAPTLVTAGNFSGTPAINDSGTVAYNAILSDGSEAIFTKAGPASTATEVIATGDTLFGSTVTVLGLSTYGLNDAGQVAFGAQLADGRTVIVRADLSTVPEPSSVLLLGLGVIGLVVFSIATSGEAKKYRCRHRLTPCLVRNLAQGFATSERGVGIGS